MHHLTIIFIYEKHTEYKKSLKAEPKQTQNKSNTYSCEATLIKAFVIKRGQSSLPLVVNGNNGFASSSNGMVSSTIIFRKQPCKSMHQVIHYININSLVFISLFFVPNAYFLFSGSFAF